jgi:sugar phosphate isomerase/epimerase
MKIGFVSAILPDLTLDEVLRFAAEEGFSCVELMCWPKGEAERRYAGVTHIDAESFDRGEAEHIRELLDKHGVTISGLGYYPNPLTADQEDAKKFVAHIKKVIMAAELLGVEVVTLVDFAADHGVRIAIENCPMLFTKDEWPGGRNLAYSPAIWRRMFEYIPNENFGLNYDPSHLVWQHIDYAQPVYEFKDRIFHVHLKDAKVHRDRLNEVGILATPLEYHTPKLPGLGDVDWGRFFSVLTDIGYTGPACVEVEDRAYESSLTMRKLALRQSRRFLSQYLPI